MYVVVSAGHEPLEQRADVAQRQAAGLHLVHNGTDVVGHAKLELKAGGRAPASRILSPITGADSRRMRPRPSNMRVGCSAHGVIEN